MDLIIRQAEPKDADEIINLVKKAMEEVPFFPGTSQEFMLTPEEEEEYIRNAALFLAAEIEGKVVGIATLDRSGLSRIRHTALLEITILKAYSNRGIGSLLVSKIIELCKANGVEKINLEVFEDNKPALALYKKFGFIEEGRRKKDIKTEAGYKDIMLLAKFL